MKKRGKRVNVRDGDGMRELFWGSCANKFYLFSFPSFVVVVVVVVDVVHKQIDF